MTKIKIISNPYKREISYFIFKDSTQTWEDIKQDSINSRLRENDNEKIFLPFKIKEIIDTIISEYYVGTDKIEIIFEGANDEYEEIEKICGEDDVKDKVALSKNHRVLENARDILDSTKEIFGMVYPLIKNIIKDTDQRITKGLEKVSDALNDIIPICIFGNYSAGKSTFINALIGHEILPSGGDPVTAKIYEIKRSQQEDRAKIKFSYLDEDFELFFDNKECRVNLGNKEKDIVKEILETIKSDEVCDLFSMVNATINIINGFEKRDKSTTLIDSVIKIEIPFSKNGILGQSRNEFVIFDTPGSNSASNVDHAHVLTEALEGFSNGIPVWVSQYDSIDSVDNATLCEKLYQIDALDKRFTMIVINKADSVELPKSGLSSEDISGIMEYESVEKMYSSGIYFVSSVMGLGAKNEDGFISEYLADVFDEKKRKFSDPTARSYKKLYEYNIMPAQIKKKAVDYSQNCSNLIYANSGIFCVEMEMEQFASRHSAYNKCQMVYKFLNEVIDETQRRISEKTVVLEKKMKEWETELDSKKLNLINSIRKKTTESVKNYSKESKAYVQNFTKEELNYSSTEKELESADREITEQESQDVNFSLYKNEFEGARSSRWSNFMGNSQKLLKGNFVESFKSLAADWLSDTQELQQRKGDMDSTKQDIDRATSDKLMNIVVDRYKRNILEAQDKLGVACKERWQYNAQKYKNDMVCLITGSEELSLQQRQELSDILLNFKPLQFDDDAEKVFIKTKFLRGNVLGIRLGSSEKLDIKRLTYIYNIKIKQSVKELSARLNNSCESSFKTWQTNLQAVIEENITKYNPELREITEFIKDESERIQELQNNQQTISESFKTIEELMAWQEQE